MSHMTLYSDGGVIGPNPSEVGGAWAFCCVQGDLFVHGRGGPIRPADVGLAAVSNNVAELVAAIEAMEYAAREGAPDLVTLHTDSLVTLRRVADPLNASMNGVPDELHERLIAAVQELPDIRLVLVAGHPTKAELAAGFKAKNRLPVSKWNVWCDTRCNLEKDTEEATLRRELLEREVAAAEANLTVQKRLLEIASEESPAAA